MPDVVGVGAGVFGAWTAHHLVQAGATATIVDAYGPGNSRSSSGDESRIHAHGAIVQSDTLQERCVKWALDSLDRSLPARQVCLGVPKLKTRLSPELASSLGSEAPDFHGGGTAPTSTGQARLHG